MRTDRKRLLQCNASISFPRLARGETAGRSFSWSRRRFLPLRRPADPAKTWAVCAHPGRLVALAAMGRGSQPGGVGLHQKPVQRQPRGHVAQRLGLGIGQISGKRDQKAQVQRAPRLLPSAAEAVHDAAQSGRPPVRLQNLEEIVPGVGRLRPSAGNESGSAACAPRQSPAGEPAPRAARHAARPRGSSPGRSPRRRSPPARPAGCPAWPEPVVDLRCCADRRRRWRRAAERRAGR